LALIIAAGGFMAVRGAQVYYVTARMVQKTNPTVSATVWPDWHRRLSLDQEAVREQVLGHDRIVRAAQAAGWTTPANPGEPASSASQQAALVAEVRDNTRVEVSHRDNFLTLVDIQLCGKNADRLVRLAPALAADMIDHQVATQRAEVQAAHDEAVRHSESAKKAVAQLTAARQRLTLEHKLTAVDPRVKLLETERAQTQALADAANKPQKGKASQKWQQIETLEKTVAGMTSSPEERARLLRHIDELRQEVRRENASDGPPSSRVAAEKAAAWATRLKEIDADLALAASESRQLRDQIDQINTAIGPAPIAMTGAELDVELAAARLKANESAAKADQQAAALRSVTNGEAVEYNIERSPAVWSVSAAALAVYLSAVAALAFVAGLISALLREWRDSAFRSVSDVEDYLRLTVAGAVPVVAPPQVQRKIRPVVTIPSSFRELAVSVETR
jgi:hypothetical protein